MESNQNVNEPCIYTCTLFDYFKAGMVSDQRDRMLHLGSGSSSPLYGLGRSFPNSMMRWRFVCPQDSTAMPEGSESPWAGSTQALIVPGCWTNRIVFVVCKDSRKDGKHGHELHVCFRIHCKTPCLCSAHFAFSLFSLNSKDQLFDKQSHLTRLSAWPVCARRERLFFNSSFLM